MALSVLSLPRELIWMIFETGDLGFEEAMGVTLTCKDLYYTCDCKSFWLEVATRLKRKGMVIPIPLFQTWQTMSVRDFRRACYYANSTFTNLVSERPTIRQHLELILPPECHVQHFVILRGGRHTITMTKDCQLHLWDLKPDKVGSDRLESDAGNIWSPKLLATFKSAINPRTIDFTIPSSSGEIVLVGIIESPDFLGLRVHVFSFQFSGDASSPVVTTQDYGVADITSQPLHAPSVRFQENGIVAYGYVRSHPGANDFVDLVYYDYRNSIVKPLHPDVAMPINADSYEVVMCGTDMIIFLASSAGIHLYSYFDYFDHNAGDLDWRVPPDRTEALPWSTSMGLAESAAWFPTLPWNVPCMATDGLVPIQCTAIERVSEVEHGAEGGENAWRPLLLPQWLNPATLAERSRNDVRSAGCNVGSAIRLPHHTWVTSDLLEILKTSTCGRYMLWMANKHDSLGAEPYLIHLPAPDASSEALSFETAARRLEVPISLIDVSYAAFSEEGGVLGLTVGELSDRVHLFYY